MSKAGTLLLNNRRCPLQAIGSGRHPGPILIAEIVAGCLPGEDKIKAASVRRQEAAVVHGNEKSSNLLLGDSAQQPLASGGRPPQPRADGPIHVPYLVLVWGVRVQRERVQRHGRQEREGQPLQGAVGRKRPRPGPGAVGEVIFARDQEQFGGFAHEVGENGQVAAQQFAPVSGVGGEALPLGQAVEPQPPARIARTQ
jgi:hypothetical protein